MQDSDLKKIEFLQVWWESTDAISFPLERKAKAQVSFCSNRNNESSQVNPNQYQQIGHVRPSLMCEPQNMEYRLKTFYNSGV